MCDAARLNITCIAAGKSRQAVPSLQKADLLRLTRCAAKVIFAVLSKETLFMTRRRPRWNALPPYGTRLILALVIALSSWAVAAPPDSQTPAATTQFEGSFDKLEVVSLGGWAWDKTKPNAAIKVEIYDGATLLATVTAEGFRADLQSAGKGDGKHAFNYALPPTLRDGQSHTISLKYSGTNSDLPGSPKTLLFPKP